MAEPSSAGATPQLASPESRWDRRDTLVALALAVSLFLVYAANSRTLSTTDSLATSLLPFAIASGDGVHLDRYYRAGWERWAYCFYRADDGHVYSTYPVAPALLALPVYGAAIAWSGADPLDPEGGSEIRRRWEKWSAASLAAVAAALLYSLARVALDRRRALLLAAVFALATPMWSISSQALWQQGPAALCFLAALLVIARASRRPEIAGAVAGLAAGGVVACRSLDVPFALALAWIATRHGWRFRVPFAAAAAAVAVWLLGYNLRVFGSWTGGLSKLTVWFFEPSLDNLLGLLVSNKGLLFYCPFVLFWAWRPAGWLRRSDGVALGVAIALNIGLYASSFGWWAGWCYGPRYWVDALPALFLLAMGGFATAWPIWRRGAFALTVLWAIALQAVGAFYFPSGESGVASGVERTFWSLRRSAPALALAAGPMPAEHPPLSWFGPSSTLPSTTLAATRLLTPRPERWPASSRYDLEIEVRNDGPVALPSRGGEGGGAVRLRAVWWAASGSPAGIPTHHGLGGDLVAGASRRVRVALLAPPERGPYRLELALVELSPTGDRAVGGDGGRLSTPIFVARHRPTFLRRVEKAIGLR